MKNKIKIATYNVQFSQHDHQIVSAITEMANDGVSLFCLQEVYLKKDQNLIQILLEELGSTWRAVCHLGKEKDIYSMGNCTIWNTDKLKIESKHLVLLPYSKKLVMHEKIFSLLAGGVTQPFRRRAVLACFAIGTSKLFIANVHLDHNGGKKNRLIQLAYVKKLLQKLNAGSPEILCGDFNCFDLLQNGTEEASYQKLLGDDYHQATSKLDWTADLHDIDTSKGLALFGKLIRLLHVHLQRKLDYVWIKKLKMSSCKKINVSGSDHKPVVVEIVI